MLTIAFTHPMEDEQQAQVLAVGSDIQLIDCTADRDRLLALPQTEILYGHPRPTELQKLTNLRWIHVLNTGCERLIQWAVNDNRQTLVITCTRGHSATQMAEHAIAGVFYLARDFATFNQTNPAGVWKPQVSFNFVAGSTALILGVGGIGRAIARKLTALDAVVRGANYAGQPVAECADMHTMDTIRQHLADVDYVINCLPMTDHTDKFIDAAFLNALKPGAGLVNISRGGVVDEPALLSAIDTGQIKGAVLDVTATEPLPEDSPLFAHPKILVTGHLSWKPNQPTTLGFEVFLANLKRYLAGDLQAFESTVDLAKGY